MAELPSQSLWRTLHHRVLPAWQNAGMERCLVAPHDLANISPAEHWTESGAKISPCPYRGPRLGAKGPRSAGNRSMILASWPKDHLVERRNSLMAIVIDGYRNLRVADKMLHYPAGHSVIIMPGTPMPNGGDPHLMKEYQPMHRSETLWIGGGRGKLSCWISHCDGTRRFERPGESCYFLDHSVKTLFDEFIRESSERRHDYLPICQHLFQALLVAMCREVRESRLFQFPYQKAEASPEFAPGRLDDPIAAAQEYIKNHLHEPLQIDEMTRLFLLSRTEFTQRFKDVTGQTFKEYLTDLRLQEACHLLCNTNWSVEHIAKAVSFQSSRLRFLFNRHYGLSPQEFRLQHRQEK